MPDSTKRHKPSKPHPDFPLYAHVTGRWAKKIRGKLHYFGPWDDPQAALIRWLDEKDDLLAGRTPRKKTEGADLRDLCNRFLTHKKNLQLCGELADRTFDRYFKACEHLLNGLGQSRSAADLLPEDFAVLRKKMAKRWGPVALGNEIQIVRSIFRFGYEVGFLEKPMRFGPEFKKPSAKTLRQNRLSQGPQMFEPEQIRKLLQACTTNMHAMILLGVNGGLGNTDLGDLPLSAVDLQNGWLDFPRPKTAVARRFPLWPETVNAIREAIDHRGEPATPEDQRYLFIGKRGQSYVGNRRGYRVNQEFARVARTAEVADRTFYDLRRTFQTVAEGSRDLVAVQAVMGHAPASGDMSAVYRQRVDDERLIAVTNHVRRWLFGGEAPST